MRIVHLVAAAAIIIAGRSLDWPWWGVVPAVFVGALAIQLAFMRLAPLSGHLGAVPIASNDPLMVAAVEQARRTWDTFLRLYPDHRETSIVKFRLRTKSDEIENVWGDLLEVHADQLTVYLRTPPVSDPDVRDVRLTVAVADVVDWQIMFPDSTLRGGFTQQATFRIIERDSGELSPKYAEQLARYRELEEQVA
jgi:hypothetical protein